MPSSQPSSSLNQLLSQRPDLWRGRRRPAAQALSSGRADLDRWLPDQGWPSGRLIELMPACFGLGELGLLLPVMAERTRAAQPVMLVAPPWIPCPQRLARAGVALDQVIVVREARHAFWAAEQGLKSGLCGLVMLWPPRGRVSERSVRRLQLAAEKGSAPVVVCYRPDQHAPPSLAALRLAIHPGPTLELLRGGTKQNTRFHLGRSNVIAWPGIRHTHRRANGRAESHATFSAARP
jgi:hypothetical protein